MMTELRREIGRCLLSVSILMGVFAWTARVDAQQVGECQWTPLCYSSGCGYDQLQYWQLEYGHLYGYCWDGSEWVLQSFAAGCCLNA